MILVGIAGKMSSGKTTVAEWLVKYQGFTKMAFADYIKTIARAGSWNGEKDARGRKYLQHIGDVMREYDEAIFIKEIARKIEAHIQNCTKNAKEIKIVVDDVRMPKEIEKLKEYGAHIWFIERTQLPTSSEAKAHKTERLTKESYAYQHIIDNNETIEQLYEKVQELSLNFAQQALSKVEQ